MKKKKLRLKRKYLVIVTIILTLISVQVLDYITSYVDYIKKEIQACDSQKKHTCTQYELEHYFKKIE